MQLDSAGEQQIPWRYFPAGEKGENGLSSCDNEWRLFMSFPRQQI